MKKTVTGFPAFQILIGTTVPELTKTYTPISHADVINHIRKEIGKAGFKITKEDYKATGNGQVGIGIYRMEYKYDKNIELLASFMNSYDTSYAFRFTMGAGVKGCDNAMFLCDDVSKTYKKFHKGDANVLSSNQIADQFAGAGGFWELALKDKDAMRAIYLTGDSSDPFYKIITDMYFETEMLTGFQLNIIKQGLKDSFGAYDTMESSLWSYYNHVLKALQESHPASWVSTQKYFHECVSSEFSLPSYQTTSVHIEPVAAPVFVDPLLESLARPTSIESVSSAGMYIKALKEKALLNYKEKEQEIHDKEHDILIEHLSTGMIIKDGLSSLIIPVEENPVPSITTELLSFGNCIIPGSFDEIEIPNPDTMDQERRDAMRLNNITPVKTPYISSAAKLAMKNDKFAVFHESECVIIDEECEELDDDEELPF